MGAAEAARLHLGQQEEGAGRVPATHPCATAAVHHTIRYYYRDHLPVPAPSRIACLDLTNGSFPIWNTLLGNFLYCTCILFGGLLAVYVLVVIEFDRFCLCKVSPILS